MKKIGVSTWCTDDYIDFAGLQELKNSFNYFHPDVDHIIFDTDMTNQIVAANHWMATNPKDHSHWMMAATGLPLVDDYDMVVHLDGDSVVVGELNELFESTEDIIGVRNNNSYNKAGCHNGITIGSIPMQGFLNAGLVAANNKEFWKEWDLKNKETAEFSPGRSDENDTLNLIFHSGKYTTKIIDSDDADVFYGIASLWGDHHHWESWKELYIKDEEVWLNDPITNQPKRVKVLHQAGGSIAHQLNTKHGGFRNWLRQAVSTEVAEFIDHISKR